VINFAVLKKKGLTDWFSELSQISFLFVYNSAVEKFKIEKKSISLGYEMDNNCIFN